MNLEYHAYVAPSSSDNIFCGACGKAYDWNGHRFSGSTSIDPLAHTDAEKRLAKIYIPVKEAEEARREFMDGQILKEGIKKDDGKPRMDLMSGIALIELAKVLTFGCKKYSANNWRLGIAWSRVVAAALRHIFSWLEGQDTDEETGLSHLAHALCCLMFLVDYEKTRKEFDDRHKMSSK